MKIIGSVILVFTMLIGSSVNAEKGIINYHNGILFSESFTLRVDYDVRKDWMFRFLSREVENRCFSFGFVKSFSKLARETCSKVTHRAGVKNVEMRIYEMDYDTARFMPLYAVTKMMRRDGYRPAELHELVSFYSSPLRSMLADGVFFFNQDRIRFGKFKVYALGTTNRFVESNFREVFPFYIVEGADYYKKRGFWRKLFGPPHQGIMYLAVRESSEEGE